MGKRSVARITLTAALILAGMFVGCDSDKATDPLLNRDLAQITTGFATQPSVSPDGRHLVFTGQGGGLVVKNITGVAAAADDTILAFGREPDWAPFGDLIAFRHFDPSLASSFLGTVDVSTRDTEIVYIGPNIETPRWSPQGDELATHGTSPNGLYLVSYPGGILSQVSCACAGESPTWSPEGDEIAYEQSTEIDRVPRSGGTPTNIVTGFSDVGQPAWSPNTEWIAFITGDSAGYTHVWVSDASGSDRGVWQVTNGAMWDLRPTWSPDSRHIYFERKEASDTLLIPKIWRVAFVEPGG